MTTSPSQLIGQIRLLKVAPYERQPGQWIEGKIHRIDIVSGKTFCAKHTNYIHGKWSIIYGYESDVTCRMCANAVESGQNESLARNGIREFEEGKDRQSKEWREAYDAYLTTPAWKLKRKLVLLRSRGLCEACMLVAPTEIHHRFYPNAWPGSEEWIRKEKLFWLVAVCHPCHEDIHSIT